MHFGRLKQPENSSKEGTGSQMSTLLIVLLVVVILGGGGWGWSRRGR